MRTILVLSAVLLLLILTGCKASGGGSSFGLMGGRDAAPAPAARSWTCGSCGGSYAAAGSCPKCGMAMVETSSGK